MKSTIEEILNKVIKFKLCEKEIIVINDCSVDSSYEIIEKCH